MVVTTVGQESNDPTVRPTVTTMRDFVAVAPASKSKPGMLHERLLRCFQRVPQVRQFGMQMPRRCDFAGKILKGLPEPVDLQPHE